MFLCVCVLRRVFSLNSSSSVENDVKQLLRMKPLRIKPPAVVDQSDLLVYTVRRAMCVLDFLAVPSFV